MLKASTVGPEGRVLLLLGLSFKDLDGLRADPGNSYILLSGETMALPVDVLIFSGAGTPELNHTVRSLLGLSDEPPLTGALH